MCVGKMELFDLESELAIFRHDYVEELNMGSNI